MPSPINRRKPGSITAVILLAALLLLPLPWQENQAGETDPRMAQAEVVVGGQVFRVDVADSPELQARGLGGRRSLGEWEGMLFVYAEKTRQTFWMKGMFIPIDIIWLDNSTVVHIEHDVQPPRPGTDDWSLPTYRPRRAGNLVLEIAAGRARALGLKVGARVEYRFNVR